MYSFISLRILYSFISLRILEPKHIRLDSTALRAQCSAAEISFSVQFCGRCDPLSCEGPSPHRGTDHLVVLYRFGCESFSGDVVLHRFGCWTVGQSGPLAPLVGPLTLSCLVVLHRFGCLDDARLHDRRLRWQVERQAGGVVPWDLVASDGAGRWLRARRVLPLHA